ncbi:hypothetical protein [Pseudomonas matsuisoli]|uniref:Uncharacterized protein n=1 Tax=Pseudomonas matsuisoli TaxID=1515666 RepID=A0A917PMV2_9PSED|nr:hypothetical protein [Pseudomonas matsuisoli]GGJ85191.1 hypothetical protein GCM10009304_09010 [Pseudomonas matsuisoli]
MAMQGDATKILKVLSKSGEITLERAMSLASAKFEDHRRYYPLALLLEEGYVGVTVPNSDKNEMPEFSYATFLYMLTLPKDKDGATHYLGLRSTGGIRAENERVYLRAKGALHLEEKAARARERVYSLIVAVSVGIIVAAVSAWFRGYVGMS